MATRLYHPATALLTSISPTPESVWEDTSILARSRCSTTSIADAMATVSFGDNNAADRDVIFRQHISLPLTVGQTITGGQAIKAQFRCKERDVSCNMFLTIGIRIINGSTVNKTVLSAARDATEADATTLTNRQFTATSAATNYTTVSGDRIVTESGMGGDPGGGSDHDSDIRYGDSAASDLAEDDTTTTDNNPWVELTDTLTFEEEFSTLTRVSTVRPAFRIHSTQSRVFGSPTLDVPAMPLGLSAIAQPYPMISQPRQGLIVVPALVVVTLQNPAATMGAGCS